MWMFLKQKISNEISARDTEVKTFINVINVEMWRSPKLRMKLILKSRMISHHVMEVLLQKSKRNEQKPWRRS
jgi:hypothetical protein